ncbi:hypothetical protein D3C87_2176380 [compost metagenome]
MNIENVVQFLKENIKNVTLLDEEYIQSVKVTDIVVNRSGTIVIRHEYGRIDLMTK